MYGDHAALRHRLLLRRPDFDSPVLPDLSLPDRANITPPAQIVSSWALDIAGKDACAQRTCCVAFEWRGRARSGANCDLFDTAAYPNACTKEGTTCASGASCWKKNLMIANVSVRGRP